MRPVGGKKTYSFKLVLGGFRDAGATLVPEGSLV